MPVATQAAIKGLTPQQVEALGVNLILNNTYHLNLRPGIEVLKEAGGAHKFQGLTVGPRVGEAMWRTVRWLDRCIEFHQSSGKDDVQNLFAIVQGGLDPDLRDQCLDEMIARKDKVAGYAIGGLSGGEEKEIFWRVIKQCADKLPEDRPRYSMGIGFAEDLLVCVALGVDMADCVFPTRTARFGVALTSNGPLNLRLSKHATDMSPIEAGCPCPTCASGTSRAILHHNITLETAAAHAITQHNLVFQARVMGGARDAIMNGTFPDYLKTFFAKFFGDAGYPEWCVNALRSVGVDLLEGRPDVKVNPGDYAKWEYSDAV
ncbi:hypothetical protein TRAPUB_2796 [Trametes pubescens]|uniref:tRNA-guanine(15) transglycosylase-like domain-containing protein n=1 Tax=Trametes pubescens TaxID=154538 RepID=A0A1M2VFH0_TRAPU|nr:hypothetical protein TRAPUB_2796 [Trametes pubescens]